jgi:hypothetical protein
MMIEVGLFPVEIPGNLEAIGPDAVLAKSEAVLNAVRFLAILMAVTVTSSGS